MGRFPLKFQTLAIVAVMRLERDSRNAATVTAELSSMCLVCKDKMKGCVFTALVGG